MKLEIWMKTKSIIDRIKFRTLSDVVTTSTMNAMIIGLTAYHNKQKPNEYLRFFKFFDFKILSKVMINKKSTHESMAIRYD